MEVTQADSQIDLGEKVEVTTEKLYEVLAGASAGGTSINHVCETTDDSPHANTVRGHLTDKFDLDTVEAVGDTLLQRDALETLPDRPMEVVAEFLELLDGLDLGVKAVYLDRGFYNSTCLGLLYAHNYAYVMPIVKWGKTIQGELSSGWSREIPPPTATPHRRNSPFVLLRDSPSTDQTDSAPTDTVGCKSVPDRSHPLRDRTGKSLQPTV